MLDVRKGQYLYWDRVSEQRSTPKHIHVHSWSYMIVLDSSFFDFNLSGAERVLHYTFLSESLYFQPTLHLILIADLFFLSCWVKCGWAYLWLAKLNGCYLAWPAGELCITHLKKSHFSCTVVFLHRPLLSGWFQIMAMVEQHKKLTSHSFITFSRGEQSCKIIHAQPCTLTNAHCCQSTHLKKQNRQTNKKTY